MEANIIKKRIVTLNRIIVHQYLVLDKKYLKPYKCGQTNDYEKKKKRHKLILFLALNNPCVDMPLNKFLS